MTPTLKAMLEAAHAGKLPDDLRKQIEPVGKADRSPAVQAAADGWRQFNEGKFRSAERSFRQALGKGSGERRGPERPWIFAAHERQGGQCANSTSKSA